MSESGRGSPAGGLTENMGFKSGIKNDGSVIFVLIYFLVLVLVFQLFFRFSFVLVFIIFSF